MRSRRLNSSKFFVPCQTRTRQPSVRKGSNGSFTAGILAEEKTRETMSLRAWCRVNQPGAGSYINAWRPQAMAYPPAIDNGKRYYYYPYYYYWPISFRGSLCSLFCNELILHSQRSVSRCWNIRSDLERYTHRLRSEYQDVIFYIYWSGPRGGKIDVEYKYCNRHQP